MVNFVDFYAYQHRYTRIKIANADCKAENCIA